MANKEGKTYMLKDQETSFTDDQTGLTVTRDQKVKIDGGKAGMKTLRMISSGGLIEVNEAPAPPSGFDANAGSGLEGGGAGDTLDESFPGYKALKEAGITTRAQAAALTTEQLIALKGIGQNTADEIAAALKNPTAKK